MLRSSTRRVLATSLACLVALGACTGDPGQDVAPDEPEGDDPAAQAPAPEPDPEPLEVASWVGDDLPLAAGLASVVDDELAVVFAEQDTTLLLLAVDARTGQERWRVPVHQHGRIRGVVQRPTVDPELRRVYSTAYDDGTRDVELVALDLDDGDEVWRVPSGWARSTPAPCGATALCLSLAEGGVEVYDRQDGTALSTSDGGLERDLDGDGDLLVTADSTQQLLEVGERDDDGYRQRWRTTFAEVWGDEADRFSPDGGWNVEVVADGGEIAVALGPVSDGNPDEVTPEVIERLADGGFALLGSDGEVIATRAGVSSCLGFVVDDLIVLCEDLDTVDHDQLDEGVRDDFDPDLPVATLGRAVALSASDGEVVWETDLPAPVARLGSDIDRAGDDGLWRVRTIDGERVLLDPADGSLRAVDEQEDDLVVRCGEVDLDAALGTVELATFDGGSQDYVRTFGGRLEALCDLDGTGRTPQELLEGRRLPSWFGIGAVAGAEAGEDDPDEDGADAPGPEQRWTLWIDPDGRLNGLGPADG